jgi:hypothetical protein
MTAASARQQALDVADQLHVMGPPPGPQLGGPRRPVIPLRPA